ncbi:helix-turn-helix domain-containing protein [Oceanispirochaeta sp.]|jgi:excisionase family DNA binding protein|uniref:helix-turn-helix transcriptional regulator n=1 Tax=Oceanispirochaeta sp. TaxID=2035350 RepID=UPI00261C1999|nr:helix-turn-helix domain-containing protein [Oceanispirochaeta sp.]MDA3957197.1 helix-turn-helix domain-containing protein [Oceanispirochaeta sp.]
MRTAITKEIALTRATISGPELAELTGLSKITVYRKMESGEIPSIHIGSRRLISNNYYSKLISGEAEA